MKSTFLALLLLSFLLLTGCGERTPSPPPDPNAFQSDIEALGALITLPEPPTEARWTHFALGNPESLAPGPTDYALLAVLRYDGASAVPAQLTAQPMLGERTVAESFIRPWFPDVVKASFVKEEGTGLWHLENGVHDPSMFAKSPLLHGYAFVAGEYVVVYLITN